jgi:hypothetical protein
LLQRLSAKPTTPGKTMTINYFDEPIAASYDDDVEMFDEL